MQMLNFLKKGESSRLFYFVTDDTRFGIVLSRASDGRIWTHKGQPTPWCFARRLTYPEMFQHPGSYGWNMRVGGWLLTIAAVPRPPRCERFGRTRLRDRMGTAPVRSLSSPSPPPGKR